MHRTPDTTTRFARRRAGLGVRALLVATAFFVVGCGSSSTKTGPAATTAATSGVAPTTAPATSATTTPTTAPATSATTPATPTTGAPTTVCSIPQNNALDHDADNNGGPNDGDGCL